MQAGDVLQVIDFLAEAGVHIWIDGGWGIDALLGEQTRPHADLDLVLRSADLSRYIQSMIEHGFRTTRVDGPYNFVMTDDDGREVDVHLVDLHRTSIDRRGVEVYGPNGLEYEVGSLEGKGMILGQEVNCCTADFQVRSHTGYDLGASDFHDVRRLHRHFGISLPAEYSQSAVPDNKIP